jgi:hypothetical protein
MKKITYHNYFIGITRSLRVCEDYLGGVVVAAVFVAPAVILLDKILYWLGIYPNKRTMYFWCPYKESLSSGNYGSVGKKKRGKYSNLWFELDAKFDYEILKITKPAKVTAFGDTKLSKVTNKKVKEILDECLPK